MITIAVDPLEREVRAGARPGVEYRALALVLIASVTASPALLLYTWKHSVAVAADGMVTERFSTLISSRNRRLRGRLRDASAAFDSIRQNYVVDLIADETLRFGAYQSRAEAERDAVRLRMTVDSGERRRSEA